MPKYYLAYGSNLNVRQMARRCPTAKAIGTSVIKDYELLFKGSKTGAYLTIEKKKGSTVPVAVWEVTDDDEKRLDAYEEYPAFYYKTDMKLPVKFTENGKIKTITAFVYIMHEDRKIGIPSETYTGTCAIGYMNFGFDMEFLNKALKKSTRGVQKMKSTEKATRICPLCHAEYHGVPATSRTDNATPICQDCGTRQSLAVLNIPSEEQEKILDIIHRSRQA